MMYQPDPYHISSNKCKIDRYSQERNSSPCLELTPARFTTMHIFIIPRKIFQYTPRVRIRMDELQFNMLFTIPLIDKILLLLIFSKKLTISDVVGICHLNADKSNQLLGLRLKRNSVSSRTKIQL